MTLKVNRERFTQDADGTWWYRAGKHLQRFRAVVKPCPQCNADFVAVRESVVHCSHTCAATARWVAEKAAVTDSRIPTDVYCASPERFHQDATGQWWYTFGAYATRLRTEIRECAACHRQFLGCPIKRTDGKPILHCSRTCGVRAAYATQDHPRKWRGEKSRAWKGGKQHRNGYVFVHRPEHPSCQGNRRTYVAEHRLVMEQTLGRFLEPHEQVHHKNGIRDDNRPENLELWVVQQPAGARVHEQQHCPTCTCFRKD